MRIEYSAQFVKDLKYLRGTPSFTKIKNLAFELIPEMETTEEITNFSKLEGFENYFRIRVGEYRIGVKMEDETLIFIRVLHRKEIYRYFP
jgi:mRNA interferase RelE/StbE